MGNSLVKHATLQEFYFLTEMTILDEGETSSFHEGSAELQIPRLRSG
jgi:hypothetical protein